MTSWFYKDAFGWGFVLWLVGYALGMILFSVMPISMIGWIIMPIGTALTLWVLFKKVSGGSFAYYFLLAIVWTLIAVACDYLFLVKAFKLADGDYKLDVNEIFPLNWRSIYSWNNNDYEEENFIVFVNKGAVKLNEEHTEFKWLNIKNFTDLIKWDSDKEELKKVLLYGLKKRRLFKKVKIDDYRKNPS